MVCECHSMSDPLILNIWACLHHYNYKDARFAAERVFAENPCEETLYLLATCLYRNNLPKQAKMLLLRHDINSPKCKYLLAKCYIDTGNYSEAEMTLVGINQELKTPADLALFYKEIAPFVLLLLSEIFKMTDRRKLAVIYLKKCLELNPFLWSAYEDLIDLRENVDPAELFSLPKGAIILNNPGSCLKALNNRINIGDIPHPNCPPVKKRIEIHDSQEDLSVSRENVNPKLNQKNIESMDTDEIAHLNNIEDLLTSSSPSTVYLSSGSPSRIDIMDHQDQLMKLDYSSMDIYNSSNITNQNRQKLCAASRTHTSSVICNDDEVCTTIPASLVSNIMNNNTIDNKPMFGNLWSASLSSMYSCVPVFHSRVDSHDMVHLSGFNSSVLSQNSMNNTKKIRSTINSSSNNTTTPYRKTQFIRRTESSNYTNTTNSIAGGSTTAMTYMKLPFFSSSSSPSPPPLPLSISQSVTTIPTSSSGSSSSSSSSSSNSNSTSSSIVNSPATTITTPNQIRMTKEPLSTTPSPMIICNKLLSQQLQQNYQMKDISDIPSPLVLSSCNPATTLTEIVSTHSPASVVNAPRTRLQVAKATAAQQKHKSHSKKCTIKPFATDIPIVVNDTSKQDPPTTSTPTVNNDNGTNNDSRINSAVNYLNLLILLGKCYKLLKYYRCKEVIAECNKLPKQHLETSLISSWFAKAQCELNERSQAHDTLLASRIREPWQLYGVVLYSSILWKMSKDSALLTLANDMIEFDREIADIWCVYGNCMSLVRDSDSAIRFFQRSIQINPKYIYGYMLLGHEYYYDDELDKSVSCFRKTLEYDQFEYAALYGLAMIFQRQENYHEANKYLIEALYIQPNSCFLLTNAGVVKSKLRHYNSSINSSVVGGNSNILSSTATSSTPVGPGGTAGANNGLTNTTMDTPNINSMGALELLEKACQLYPRDPLCRFHKASILFQMGHCHEALADLKLLVSVAPKEAKVYLLMSLIHKQMGDMGQSMMYSSRATELDPKCNNDSLLLDRTFCQTLTSVVPTPSCSSVSNVNHNESLMTPHNDEFILMSSSSPLPSSPTNNNNNNNNNNNIVLTVTPDSTHHHHHHHQSHNHQLHLNHQREGDEDEDEDDDDDDTITHVNQLSFDFLE